MVFRVDPRSASGKGAASAWTCYKQLGVQELKDLEEAVAWLGTKPWMDSSRVGISGHSYGGFMAAYALTHSKTFSAGIASGPVTDWQLYDTIYTERYMLTPKENPDGYDRTSVVTAAKNLHGRLLIVHGMMDDNVHMQNSTQLVDALQKAGKDFEMMFYPQARHGLGGPHYYKVELEFIRRTMGVKGASGLRRFADARRREERFCEASLTKRSRKLSVPCPTPACSRSPNSSACRTCSPRSRTSPSPAAPPA